MDLTTLDDRFSQDGMHMSDCPCNRRSGAFAKAAMPKKAAAMADNRRRPTKRRTTLRDFIEPLSSFLGGSRCCGKTPGNQNINHIVIGGDSASQAMRSGGGRGVGRGINAGISQPSPRDQHSQPQSRTIIKPVPVKVKVPIIKRIIQKVKQPVYRDVQRPINVVREKPIYRDVQRPIDRVTRKTMIVTPDRRKQNMPVREQLNKKGQRTGVTYRSYY